MIRLAKRRLECDFHGPPENRSAVAIRVDRTGLDSLWWP
jgi:hypothetical protein